MRTYHLGYSSTAKTSLYYKPVNNRKSRPKWAMNDKQLMRHCFGRTHMRRFEIAQMYWQKNMSAKDIAAVFGMKRSAVSMILTRLREKADTE